MTAQDVLYRCLATLDFNGEEPERAYRSGLDGYLVHRLETTLKVSCLPAPLEVSLNY